MKNKINNVYIDGSYQCKNNIIGIGVYNSHSKFKFSMVKNGSGPFEAEYEALDECIKYCRHNDIIENSRIFTDCRELYISRKDEILSLGFHDFVWIPRELNKEADRLAGLYKNYSEQSETKLIITDGVIINKTTNTIKTQTATHNLSVKQILDILLGYPMKAREKLIKKLSTVSSNNKRIYKNYLKNGNISHKNAKNTYLCLIYILHEIPNNGHLPIQRNGLLSLLKKLKKLKD